MKRSAFKNRGQPLARGTSKLTTSKPLRAKSAMKRSTPLKAAAVADPAKRAKPKKSRGPGLKGRTPTAAEQRFMDLAGQVPCMACKKDGRENTHILLHHVDGRVKPGAHFMVLPLCFQHHVPDKSDPLERVAVHGAKKIFSQLYGTERELLAELYEMLKFTPPTSEGAP